MDENVKNNQVSDEELDTVTGGEKRSCYYVNEKVSKCIVYECPKCNNKYYIPQNSVLYEKFKYNYGVSGGDDIYCPDCYPKAMLKLVGLT